MNTTPASTAAQFAIMPLRFSDQPAQMIAFLRTLGLADVVTTQGDNFAELVAGGGGRVLVHAAAGSETRAHSGTTDLCLMVDSADEAARVLVERGLDAEVWDESYGRQGALRLPGGEVVALNEKQQDLYGYQGHPGTGADERLRVVGVLDSPDMDADQAWAQQIGLRAEGEGDEWYRSLGAPGAGALGLHGPGAEVERTRDVGSELGPSLLVRLGLETSEDLASLAERLTAAGYPARVVDEHGLRAVHLTDPDGEHLEIHPRSDV